jgi:hypothetical protein
MAEQNINVAQQDTLETVASNVTTINTNAARLTAARATKIDNIGATGDTGGSSTAGTLFGKLNKIISDIATFVGNWTATRAGYIDNIRSYTITNNTASKTGVLSAKLAYVINLLENTTYGLSAIKTAVSSSGSGLKSVTKTFNSASYVKWGLTEEQMATLYSIKTVNRGVTGYINFYYHLSKGDAFVNLAGGGASIYFNYSDGYSDTSYTIYASSSNPVTATFYYFG